MVDMAEELIEGASYQGVERFIGVGAAYLR